MINIKDGYYYQLHCHRCQTETTSDKDCVEEIIELYRQLPLLIAFRDAHFMYLEFGGRSSEIAYFLLDHEDHSMVINEEATHIQYDLKQVAASFENHSQTDQLLDSP